MDKLEKTYEEPQNEVKETVESWLTPTRRLEYLKSREVTVGNQHNKILANVPQHIVFHIILDIHDELYSQYHGYSNKEPKFDSFKETLDHVDKVVLNYRDTWGDKYNRHIVPIFKTDLNFINYIKSILEMQKEAIDRAFYEVAEASKKTHTSEIKFD